MSLAVRVLSVLLRAAALVTPALRWRRAAFAGFVVVGLGTFARRAGWPTRPLTPTACEGLVETRLALYSFRNTPHLALFALCFIVASAQFRGSVTEARSRRRANAGALAMTLAIGALVELAEGVSGAGHCRLRDLLPDGAGALLGWSVLAMMAPLAARGRRMRDDAATISR
jgi:hypothetical protein